MHTGTPPERRPGAPRRRRPTPRAGAAARVGTAVIATAAVVAGPAADAHYINPGWFRVWDDGQFCTYSTPEIGHDPGVYSRGGVYVTESFQLGPWQQSCNANPNASDIAANRLAVAANLVKLVNGQWTICGTSGFVFNQGVQDELYIKASYATQCGNGNYGTMSWSFFIFNNEWKGSWAATPLNDTHPIPIPAGK